MNSRDYKAPLVIAYTSTRFGEYKEGVGTLKASGGDIGGGGSETWILETMVFDETHITSPINGSNPQWGDLPYPVQQRQTADGNYQEAR